MHCGGLSSVHDTHNGREEGARVPGDTVLLPLDMLDLDGDGDDQEPLPLDLVENVRLLGPATGIGAYETPVN